MIRPQPLISGFEDQRFWDYCRKGELRVQRCRHCGRHIWPILPACPDDLSSDLDWVRVSEIGTISSWVIYHRVYHPEFVEVTPYICANIELPEGVRFTGNVFGPNGEIKADAIVGPNPRTDQLNGRRVRLFFEDAGHDLQIPQWRLIDS